MVQNIAYSLIFGKPVIMYMGILTYLSLISTATIGALNFKGITVIPFRWHPRFAAATILLATLHALMGLSTYFNF
ncbi:MAG TPA: hypothetical protein VK254_02140 [Candidatus Bathyarchaeia archaeon]|nr:hypothetical protein [Candidatus Bathyarchaeia archaeon]